jgi:AraC-like DNA-binding protein
MQQIAAEIGYEPEAAFNRTFRCEFGAPPALTASSALPRKLRPAHRT